MPKAKKKTNLIRPATVLDAKSIQDLLKVHSRKSNLIARSLNEIYERIRSFIVIEEKGKVIACCCLHVLWDDLAEIKSLAVSPDHQKKDYGNALVRRALSDAAKLKVTRVFALTLIPEFFERFGFERIEMCELPKKIWFECVNCIHYPDDCCEVAVIKNIG